MSSTDTITSSNSKFHVKQLVIPTLLIGHGVIGIESDGIKGMNTEIRDELTENIDDKITIDDFSQYAPVASVYALNLAGVKGKSNFRDRTTVIATSYLIVAGSVMGLKSLTKIERPDGSSKNSFPSGHTATAFAGAEFLWQEYKDVSIWYGITGYVVASGTGLFRMYNDRHWFTDVMAGAGIGILSTKIAYWVNPFIKKKIFGKKTEESKTSVSFIPFYNREQAGFGVAVTF
ncbi:phosphatase PAP2 family protein [Flavobacterium arcticum]|nr:phosphatase PAP2 family protein [Flavobacterium arcticum]